MAPCALTIAGSDPSGGAGIQQDLKVFAALGVAGLSAITALTVQNSQGVLAVHPVPADVLFDQIEAILEDSRVRAVKIGMLGGAEQVRAVAEALRRFQPPNVVLDPALASTGGVSLLDDAGKSALIRELLPLSDVITPNILELGELTGMRVDFFGFRERAVRRLQEWGAKAVLVTGGHLKRNPVDVLFLPAGGVRRYLEYRVDTPHIHGTGCFLSSAIAARLAVGANPERAVESAKRLVTEALGHPIVIGAGRGYPDAMRAKTALRELRLEQRKNPGHFLGPSESGLYVLTDSGDRSHVEIVKAALEGGARAIQLREKRMPTAELIALGKRVAAMVREARGLMIVNDRVDVALACHADGVHLGPDDMPPADARRILGSDKLIGVSVGTVAEAKPLARCASYFGVGAVFGSASKQDADAPVGIDRIREIKQAFPNHPIVAIGGIDAENIGEVAAAGADAAAVISAVVNAPDMAAATAELVRRFEEARPKQPEELQILGRLMIGL